MRLNQVTVGTVDIPRAERFYTTLGLVLIVRDVHYLRFECSDGESTFSAELVDSVSPDEHVTIYFECDDLDGEYERLIAAGMEFEHEPRDMPWLWREARVRDPDGHRVCLFNGGVNRKNPPWRLV